MASKSTFERFTDEALEIDYERLENLPEGVGTILRWAWWWIRKTFAVKDETGPRPALIVPRSKWEIERQLGRHYFEPGWELSYYYKGEILNLRRPEFVDYDGFERLQWWQTHLRGYVLDDGSVALTPHFEPDPSEQPDAHRSQQFIERDRAVRTLKTLFDDEGVPYRERENWERSGPKRPLRGW